MLLCRYITKAIHRYGREAWTCILLGLRYRVTKRAFQIKPHYWTWVLKCCKKKKKKPCGLMYIMKWGINFSFLSLTFCVWKKLVKLWMKVWNFVSSKKWESCKQEISSSSCKLREYCAYAKKSKNMTTNIDNQFSRPFTAKHEDFMYF